MAMNDERCPWAVGQGEEYRRYHDEEWGRPLHDDRALFELLILEGMQAGLSWLTILKKRENFRRAFDGFDVATVAAYDDEKLAELLKDTGIIRNRLKISAARGNAQAFLRVQEEFGSFDAYYWAFSGGETIVNRFASMAEVPAETELSQRISKDLKKRGFRFVGPTIVYAYMQSTGMVDDHLTSCPCHCDNQPR